MKNLGKVVEEESLTYLMKKIEEEVMIPDEQCGNYKDIFVTLQFLALKWDLPQQFTERLSYNGLYNKQAIFDRGDSR